jgi:hypothetical protein
LSPSALPFFFSKLNHLKKTGFIRKNSVFYLYLPEKAEGAEKRRSGEAEGQGRK